MTVCPRCGARATYVGIVTVECATEGCPNFRQPPPAPPAAPPETKEGDGAEKSPEDEELLTSMLEGGFF
ncbi:hypothetical protein [Polyangium spumosum]|uniref:Uncharacterized protein n=1 Tax=Polyangium spumosum TaxID=889282 RepID=A0A6N7PML0_9BACT|nr:hypothetical protein [Polyangium spumosum]MRG93149.1 hypothetical protein [Polyangium spumosum]